MAVVQQVFIVILTFLACIAPVIPVDLMCDVANVKVESEDGRTQTFEMKKLEPKGDSCSLCGYPAVNNAPDLTALKANLVLYISDKELSSSCC